ncbi:carbohydrate kinase family protein [Butyrivibrio sp. XBB1001]|uniref:carbohydrate kinase family protein n=1 Tax=Butyrivibrio sp. XBB1001 TaxID=1280682 RepID=UPI0004042484|nr:carbohydrate kinase [Butyrivibrio sp. XBB1001]
MKKIDVAALGELLIDFTASGDSSQGNPLFEANPGGAPCNVLSMLQNLGNNTAFIGKVGRDFFGNMLKTRVEVQGVDTSGLVMDDLVHTTLAFVNKLPNGDRDFSFYRKPGADMMLTVEEVNENADLIRNADIFHLGTLSMTDEPARGATKRAVEIAKNSGALISFDPNYRQPLWDSVDSALQAMKYGFENCDILKISDNEIELFTGCTDILEGAKKIKEEYSIPIVFATLGPDGSIALYKDMVVKRDGFKNPDTIETTGAGDTFCACAIDYIHRNGLDDLSKEGLYECLTFANAAASIITTRKGALSVMPSKEEVIEFIKSRK